MTEHRRTGFTLVEVLIVVAVIGILAFALAAIFSVVVRTTPPTEARADDARSLLGISTWLPADVSSTPRMPTATASPNWDDSPTRSSGCAGTDPGSNIVRLAWREDLSGAPQNFIASYRLVDDGETSRIVRLTCGPGGPASVQNVTADLPPVSSAPTDLLWKYVTIDGVQHIDGLEFEITTIEGERLRVDASSRNPNETLGTVPAAVTTSSSSTTSTTTPPPTTTTTTTSTTTTTTVGPGTTTTTTTLPNQPPLASPVALTAQRDANISFDVSASDPNGDPLTLTLGTLPSGWTASVSGLQVTIPASSKGTGPFVINYTVTDPAGASASSTITINLRPIKCAASFDTTPPTATPSTAKRKNAGSGHLLEPLNIWVTPLAGDCAGQLFVRYDRTVTGVPPTGSPTVDVGDSLLVTIASNSAWVTGNHVLQLVIKPTAFWPEEVVAAHNLLVHD